MGEFYERQEDGSLKPLEIPSQIAKSAAIYMWLRTQALNLEEIKFIVTDADLQAYTRESV
jgi:hypothetical protein